MLSLAPPVAFGSRRLLSAASAPAESRIENRVGISDAVKLLLEQEDQGIAADVTQDLFITTAMANSQLYEAVLAYFRAGVAADPNSETYSSLIYVCVKLRRLDEAFQAFEEMMDSGATPDDRTYAHLIKGCGRSKQMKRGEMLFKLLKQRNAPGVYSAAVYNAMINMYAHQRVRGHHLLPSEAAPAWALFEEMQANGVRPDQVTYNSLIGLCGRTSTGDATRAYQLFEEMDEVGLPLTEITLACMAQVLGRRFNQQTAREKLKELVEREDLVGPVSSNVWRPLLHSAASSGDVAATTALYEDMAEKSGSTRFDSFAHRVSHASNYLILAEGYANGYDAAHAKFLEARESGAVDVLTYSFMLELVGELKGRRGGKGGKGGKGGTGGRGAHLMLGDHAQTAALDLWEQMVADGIAPNAALCHRMFPVWMQAGMAEEAERTFGEMKGSSTRLAGMGRELADKWMGGDLTSVKQLLAESPLATQQMCHTSYSYVRFIDACLGVRDTDRAAAHLSAFLDEASERGIALGHESTTPLLNMLLRDGARNVELALSLFTRSADAGRPCAASGAFGLCGQLIKLDRLEEAASVLQRMQPPGQKQAWAYTILSQRVRRIQRNAAALPEDSELRESLETSLAEIRERYGLEEEALPGPLPEPREAGAAEGAAAGSGAAHGAEGATDAVADGAEHEKMK